jgi:predicted dehydrogenase
MVTAPAALPRRQQGGTVAAEGMTYAPEGRPRPACRPGELEFAAVGLDHGHIYGMCNGLTEAGAELKWVFDPDPGRVAAFVDRFPQARPAATEAQVLEDPAVQLVAAANVPADHCALGLRVLEAGKDFFSDKPGLTTLAQLAEARAATARTGRRYAIYYSERVHVESAVFAGRLVADGAIGRVVHVAGFGPHRPSLASRPEWFFQRERYGGILCDIGSHQAEQFLFYTGNHDARVVASRVANYAHPEHPELEDFGDCTLLGEDGASGYFRVDWFTPAGLSVWGDGRTFIVGTEGFIELRKYVDLARASTGDHVLWADGSGEHHFDAAGQVGYPFFAQLVRDCLDRTDLAMPQEHAFKAAELCVLAEAQALRAGPGTVPSAGRPAPARPGPLGGGR